MTVDVHDVGQRPIPRLLDVLGIEPVAAPDLWQRLLATGQDVSLEDVEGELRVRADVLETDDGWVNLLAASEGVVLTHVLTAEERDLGVLGTDGDLDLWAMLADEGLSLASGGEVRTRWQIGPLAVPVASSAGLGGPEGWLDRFQPGDLLALRMSGSTLAVERAQAPGQASVQRGADVVMFCREKAAEGLSDFVADVDDEPDVSPWILLDTVVARLVVERPQLLRAPLPPLRRLLVDAGLQVARGFVALPGVPPLDQEEDYAPAEIQALVHTHSLLQMLRLADLRPEGLRELLSSVASSAVFDSLAAELKAAPLQDVQLQPLLEAAESDAERGAALALAAISAEGRRDFALAEQRLEEASRLVTTPRLLAAAASYAAARGDLVRADALLAGAGCGLDDPIRRTFRPLLQPPSGVVSRNRPCPCGSGRKYKACCLREVRHPLPARASLAYARLLLHIRQRGLLDEVLRIIDSVDEAAQPLAIDLAVFEMAVARDYLESLGHALADDERRLVEAWTDTPLAPYEVVDVQRGRSVTLRPLLGDASLVLHDRAFSMCADRLDLCVARPLFDGEKHVLLSVPAFVHRLRRTALTALFADGRYDLEEVVRFLGPQPPPVLRNRDGEDLVLCEAVYKVPAHLERAGWEKLGEHLVADDDSHNRLVLAGRQVRGREHLLRGSVTREGNRWSVETNSVERFEELRSIVLDAAPDADLVTESTVPGADALQPSHEAGSAVLPADRGDPHGEAKPGLTPEREAALLEEYMRSYEQSWAEERVPALEGMTPRQAAESGGPARAELEALLDDMEWMQRQGAGGMDAGHLRRLLGLTA